MERYTCHEIRASVKHKKENQGSSGLEDTNSLGIKSRPQAEIVELKKRVCSVKWGEPPSMPAGECSFCLDIFVSS